MGASAPLDKGAPILKKLTGPPGPRQNFFPRSGNAPPPAHLQPDSLGRSVRAPSTSVLVPRYGGRIRLNGRISLRSARHGARVSPRCSAPTITPGAVGRVGRAAPAMSFSAAGQNGPLLRRLQLPSPARLGNGPLLRDWTFPGIARARPYACLGYTFPRLGAVRFGCMCLASRENEFFSLRRPYLACKASVRRAVRRALCAVHTYPKAPRARQVRGSGRAAFPKHASPAR